MKRAISIIYILIVVLLITINVWAQGVIIHPGGIINMAQINNFQGQRLVGINPAEIKAGELDLLDIGSISKISDSIARDVDLLSNYVDKYI